MNVMGQIEEGMKQLAIASAIQTALLGALTEREKINLSTRVMGNRDLLPSMIISWVKTEEGALALRALVDKFTGDEVKA
jgi:hypothetical protein